MYKMINICQETGEELDTCTVDAATVYEYGKHMVDRGLRSPRVQIDEMLEVANRGEKITYRPSSRFGYKFSIEKV